MLSNVSKNELQLIFKNQLLNLESIQKKVLDGFCSEESKKPLISDLTKNEIKLIANKTLFPSDLFISLIRDDLKNYLMKEYKFIDNDILKLDKKGESLLFVVLRGINILSIDLLNKNFCFLYNESINNLLFDKKSIEEQLNELSIENFNLSKEFLNTKKIGRRNSIVTEKENNQFQQNELNELLIFTKEKIMEEKDFIRKEIEIQDLLKKILNGLSLTESLEGRNIYD